jgi:ankyrin repeat protein
LLERGLGINARNSEGQTPIFDLTKRLPNYIGEHESMWNAGFTGAWNALEDLESIAIERAISAQVLKMFEDAEADLFVVNKYGPGLLHVAARSKEKITEDYMRKENCRRLGVNLQRRAQRKARVRFELLMKKGLDLALEDNQQRTALDIAAACNNQGVLDLFKKIGRHRGFEGGSDAEVPFAILIRCSC